MSPTFLVEVITEEEVMVGCFLQKNQDKKVIWIIFSLLMQRWLFKIEGVERLIKLPSMMPTKRKQEKELVFLSQEGCVRRLFHLM